MKYLPLLWAGLWRKPVRTLLTCCSVAVAFVLFGSLYGISAGVDAIIERISANRVRVQSNTREPLPVGMYGQLKQVPHVGSVILVAFFGSYFQDQKNTVGTAAIGGDISLHTRPDIRVSREQSEAFMKLRTGAVVGGALAREHGWQLGDRVALASYQPQRDGSSAMQFDIAAIYELADGSDTAREFWVHYDYFDEGRSTEIGTVNSFLLRTSDPQYNRQVIERIDTLFANSSHPTITQSDREWQNAGLKQTLDINLMVNAIVGAALFTLLVLTGNTMMQSVRQRRPELAVLKTLGFSNFGVLALVLAEAVLLCVSGAALGLLIAKALFPKIAGVVGLAALSMPPSVPVLGMVIALATGVLSASVPALQAKRLSVVAALAR